MNSDRYLRQRQLIGFGEDGQEKLGQCRILVVGAGGLGSPLLYNLCAAGFGYIGISEEGFVEESNLNRQILYTTEDIGKPKALVAAKRLNMLNETLSISLHPALNKDNAREIISGYAIIADCTDNDKTRHLINKTALTEDKYLVEGGINGFSGFVMGVRRSCACYGCLELPKKEGEEPTPSLGALTGIIAGIQAAECIKAALGIGEAILNRALLVDAYNARFIYMDAPREINCPICKGLY